MIKLLASVASVLALLGCAATPPTSRVPSALPNVSVLTPPLVIPGLDRQRTLRVYVPPSYAQGGAARYPVIYMHDGQNLFDDATSYAGEWGVDETMNELARTHGFEAIVVGIDNGLDKRMAEMSPWANTYAAPKPEGEAYTRFIVEVVKPFIDTHYRTRSGAADTAVMGSSMGGLISHYAMHRDPGVFGRAGVFSPAYQVTPEMFAYAAERPLAPGARIYIYAGGREGGNMASDARRMHALLAERMPAANLALSINEQAQHNEPAWRAEFARAVIWMFELRPR